MHIIVCGDATQLSERAAEHIRELHAEAHGRLSLGLAGGTTPGPAYRLLAETPMDWTETVLWLGDERWVPHDDPDSNTGMIERLLADHVDATFLPFPYSSESDPADAARAYGEQLVAATGGATLAAILGMGDDGHTASLFPGTDALTATGVYCATWVSAKDSWRVTATFDYLRSASHLVFLVSGANKAEVLAHVIEGSLEYPAGQLVKAARGEITFIVDAAAASEISGTIA